MAEFIYTEKQLKEVYEHSQSTIIGAGSNVEETKEWIEGISKWMKENDFGEMTNIVIFKGKEVNNIWKLEGDNRFPDDLTFLSWSNDGIKNMNRYCLARFNLGIRWFDDIIDNSIRHQEED